MAAQKRLLVSTLGIVLIAAQPAKALEWELVTNEYPSGQSIVPDYKPAHADHRLEQKKDEDGVENESARNITNHAEDEKVSDNIESTVPAEESTLNERLSQNKKTKDSLVTKAETVAHGTTTGITEENSLKKRDMQLNNKKESSGTDINSSSLHYSGGVVFEPRWELVTEEGRKETEVETTKDISNFVVWEHVPIGQEIIVDNLDDQSELISTQESESENKAKAKTVMDQRSGWVSRLIGNLRKRTISKRGQRIYDSNNIITQKSPNELDESYSSQTVKTIKTGSNNLGNGNKYISMKDASRSNHEAVKDIGNGLGLPRQSNLSDGQTQGANQKRLLIQKGHDNTYSLSDWKTHKGGTTIPILTIWF